MQGTRWDRHVFVTYNIANTSPTPLGNALLHNSSPGAEPAWHAYLHMIYTGTRGEPIKADVKTESFVHSDEDGNTFTSATGSCAPGLDTLPKLQRTCDSFFFTESKWRLWRAFFQKMICYNFIKVLYKNISHSGKQKQLNNLIKTTTMNNAKYYSG